MSVIARFLVTAVSCILIYGSVSYAEISGDALENADTPVTVRAEVDSGVISIGDKIRYTVTLKTGDGIEVERPLIGDDLPAFEVRDFGSSKGGLFSKGTRTYWFLIDTYETGKHTIPGTTVKYRNKEDEEWSEIITNEVSVEVKSVLDSPVDKADIKDIKGPVSFQSMFYLYVILSVLAVAVTAALVILFLRKTRKGVKEQDVPRVPAHETAYAALRDLLEKEYLKKGGIRDYYFELSDIVRHYVENRFRLRAPEMTTEEFLVTLKNSDVLNSGQKGLMREFLSHCDMVKFAQYLPDEKESRSSYESAKRFVDQTREDVIS